MKKIFDALTPYPAVVSAIDQLAGCRQRLLDLAIQVQQIPAPTFAEGTRAAWVQQQFLTFGLADVTRDEANNVYGRILGRTRQPALLVSAHTDTVFPAETDLAVRQAASENRVYGPGLGDNSTGVAALLSLAETLSQLSANSAPPVDIWLVANTGEEGLGDLYGMRAAVDRLQPQIGACVVIEGTGLGRVVHRALGSRRYRISVDAPGGHSWSAFGSASAIHVLTQLAAALTKLDASAHPRTTFNIGRIGGGTSINSIAQHAWLELDLRSEGEQALNQIVQQVMAITQRYQTHSWQQRQVTVQIELIGDRPAGEIAEAHPLVQAANQFLAHYGFAPDPSQRIASTDANVPLSRGIPAVCVGITDGGNAHRLDEWIDPTPLAKGLQHLVALVWWSTLWLDKQTK